MNIATYNHVRKIDLLSVQADMFVLVRCTELCTLETQDLH